MARTQTPDGKRVTICIKVSEPEAAVIDAARGTLTRSAWGRDALIAQSAGRAPAVKPKRPARASQPATTRPAPTAAALAQERSRDLRDDPEPAPCPHAYPDVKTIMGKRVCRKCDA
jgi:hypothetical protein